LASGNLGIERLVFTGISFAYFGGKRKEEGRREKFNTEDTEKKGCGLRS
jgi:hypothetical protein